VSYPTLATRSLVSLSAGALFAVLTAGLAVFSIFAYGIANQPWKIQLYLGPLPVLGFTSVLHHGFEIEVGVGVLPALVILTAAGGILAVICQALFERATPAGDAA
jgi:hypothetical protein